MKILVDADACPVVDETIRVGKRHGLEVILITDTSHLLEREGARTITVEKGGDSADFRLVNLLKKGDIAVTQDYGLAAMALARGALVLNQNGLIYTDSNIDTLLLTRHLSKKARMAGERTKGPSKRTREQDQEFERTLERLAAEQMQAETGAAFPETETERME